MLVTTTRTGTVEVICSLIPFEDERIALGLLKARLDLNILFTLHYRGQKIPGEQNADYSNKFKANELWRVLRSPLEYRAPWDWLSRISSTTLFSAFPGSYLLRDEAIAI